MPTTMTGQNRRLDRCRIETTRFSGPEYQRRMARIIQCSMGGGLARIIHERFVAKSSSMGMGDVSGFE